MNEQVNYNPQTVLFHRRLNQLLTEGATTNPQGRFDIYESKIRQQILTIIFPRTLDGFGLDDMRIELIRGSPPDLVDLFGDRRVGQLLCDSLHVLKVCCQQDVSICRMDGQEYRWGFKLV